MLSLKEIKELIDLVSERGLAGLEIERTGFRLRIEGGRSSISNGLAEGASVPAAVAPASPGSAAPPAAEEAEDVHVITSPIVGTFYRAPSRRPRRAPARPGRSASRVRLPPTRP